MDGPYIELMGYDGFTIPFNAVAKDLSVGQHHIKIAISDTGLNLPISVPELEELNFDSGIFITAGTLGSEEPQVYGTENLYDHGGLWQGDESRERAQGQTIIDSNFISNSLNNGIVFDSGDADNLPHPGPTANLLVENQDGLVPAASITNNLIANSGAGGILFSGFEEGFSGTNGATAVPFGRIVNNTIYGGTQRSDSYGIKVEQYAGPTLLNNIVSSVGTGIDVDTSSRGTTVYDNTVYHNVVTTISGGGLKTLDDVLAASDPLFVDPEHGNFYLDRGSVAIDSATNVVQDRLEMSFGPGPAGISRSPILAPDRRSVRPVAKRRSERRASSGFGPERLQGPRCDRPDRLRGSDGRIDQSARQRRERPQLRAWATSIRRQRAVGELLDPTGRRRRRNQRLQRRFRSGRVVPGRPVLLEDGLDYFFQYNTNTNVIQLIPIAGIWADGHEYTIRLDNDGFDGIRDLGEQSDRSRTVSTAKRGSR